MTVQTPIPDFRAAREAMIDSQLRPQGVSDDGVVRAMGASSASVSCPPSSAAGLYRPRVALGNGRFLPAPAMLGQLLTELQPKPGERGLVVGSGTGYSAAVLAAIGVRVTALESTPPSLPRRASLASQPSKARSNRGSAAGRPTISS